MEKSFSLKSILIGFLTLVLAVSIILIGFISYTIFSTTMTEQIAKSRIDVLSQISERVTALNEKVMVMSNFYHFNNAILDYYDGEAFSGYEEGGLIVENFHQIDKLSDETIRALDIDLSYSFHLDNGFSYDSDEVANVRHFEEYEKELWYSEVLKAKGQPVWISTYRESDSDNYIFFYCKKHH